MEIDGLTIEQVRYNIYAFRRDVRIFARKVERARLEHTKAKWQRKLANAKGYLENNQERLARFEAVEHGVQADVCPGCGAPNATVINSIHEYVCEECGTSR